MSIRSALACGALSVGLALGGGTAAFATTVYPAEGGIWNYGVVAGVHLYSDYFNQNQCHGTSTRNDWGLSSSANTAANVWATNSQPTTVNQNNRAYYRVC
jgi:lactococcin 972 family bacteriocin